MSKTNQMVEKLKNECKGNSALSAVLHLFALRKRARSSLTLDGLKQKMAEEGFSYSRAEYEKILKTLADAGLGTLKLSPKGEVRAIQNITVTLQSLGAAVCGGKPGLTPLKAKHRYVKVPKPATTTTPTTEEPQKITVLKQPLILTWIVNGKPVNLRVPDNFTAKDFEELFNRIAEHSNEPPVSA